MKSSCWLVTKTKKKIKKVLISENVEYSLLVPIGEFPLRLILLSTTFLGRPDHTSPSGYHLKRTLTISSTQWVSRNIFRVYF